VVLGAVGDAGAESAAFPGARIRTEVPAPSIAVVDHEGRPLTLEALRGRVVMVTGIYATCSLACPMILSQAKRALAELTPEERDAITVVAVTLDPERDDPPRLHALATAQGVAAPAWRLAGGDPRAVNAALDALGITRRRDPETGVIDHASLFLLVDRGGRVAYRFTLGELQERWTVEALRSLVRE
jgi:protein SCO1/2